MCTAADDIAMTCLTDPWQPVLIQLIILMSSLAEEQRGKGQADLQIFHIVTACRHPARAKYL